MSLTPAVEIAANARKTIVSAYDDAFKPEPLEGETPMQYAERKRDLYADYLRSSDDSRLSLSGEPTRFTLRPLTRHEVQQITIDGARYRYVDNQALRLFQAFRAFTLGCVEVSDGSSPSKFADLVQIHLGQIVWEWSTEVPGPFGAPS